MKGIKNEIAIKGMNYHRMYDDEGEFNDDKVKVLLNGKDIEEL